MRKLIFNFLTIFFIMLFFLSVPVFGDTLVVVSPKVKITTSDQDLKEGDSLDFVVLNDVFMNNKLIIEKGSLAQGIVTYLEPNTWAGSVAKLTVEQFVVRDINNKRIKLIGNVYKEGSSHDFFLDLTHNFLIRGGEAQIKPKKNKFNFYIKENL